MRTLIIGTRIITAITKVVGVFSKNSDDDKKHATKASGPVFVPVKH